VTGLPYVLVILFALGDGSVITMNTEQQFSSPLLKSDLRQSR